MRYLEEMVLGACIVDYTGVPVLMSNLNDEHFEHEKGIFQTIKKMFDKGLDIDICTVSHFGKHDFLRLMEIVRPICSSAHIKTHCLMLKEILIKRKLLESGQMILSDNGDILESLDTITNDLNRLMAGVESNRPKHISEIILEPNQEGLPSGFSKLDRIIGGLKKGYKYEIAGTTSMGKSAFILNIINYVCIDLQKPTLLFSLEMLGDSILLRLISLRTGIPFRRLEMNDLFQDEEEKVSQVKAVIKSSPLFIDDFGELTPTELKAKTLELKAEHKLELIAIDYLGLMTVKERKNKTIENIVSEIAKSTKSLAMITGLPLLEAAQLNRRTHDDSMPKMHHLRDSGQVEQSADVILFPYRPGHTNPEIDPSVVELMIAKNRNGEVNISVDMRYKYFKFEEVEKPENQF